MSSTAGATSHTWGEKRAMLSKFLPHRHSTHYVKTRQRGALSSESWLLGSDCLDETQCMKATLGGQVCFSCSCSYKVKILARQALWAEF